MTQLGHVKDLATAFVKALGNKKAYNQIYNIAGVGGSVGGGVAVLQDRDRTGRLAFIFPFWQA